MTRLLMTDEVTKCAFFDKVLAAVIIWPMPLLFRVLVPQLASQEEQ